MAKYLIVGALIALLLLFVYSRLYPYIQALKKAIGVAKSITSAHVDAGHKSDTARKGDQKLVRCVGCGTWVPADRVLGNKVGTAYCSSQCLESRSVADKHRAAG